MPTKEEILYLDFDKIKVMTYDELINLPDISNRNIYASNLRGGTLAIGSGDKVLKYDSRYGFWLGHANFASAPFRVTMAGAVTATSITITGASIDGTSTVGGRLASTLASAIDASGDFINAKLNTSTQQILDGFAFTASGALNISSAQTAVDTTASTGDTSLVVVDASVLPTSGIIYLQGDTNWMKVTYTGVSTNTLTGIPASGSGSITEAAASGNQVLGGPGILLTPKGLVALNSSGAETITLDGATGNATFAGTLAAAAGTLGTVTAGILTGVTIKTATAEADARIYMTGSTIRLMDAATPDARYNIEISSVGSRISFFDWVGGVPSQTEQTRLYSDDSSFTIQRYDNEGAVEKRYRFYDTYFVSIGADLGVTGVNSWANAYFTGKVNSKQVSIIQTNVNSGTGLNISRNLPNTETTGPLAQILNDNLSDDQKCLYLVNDGTGATFGIYNRDTTHTSNPKAIDILNYSNSNSIYIDHPADDDVNDVYAIYINCNNAGTKLPGGIDMSSFSVGEPLLKVVADATDPTGAGGAAAGRIAIDIAGAIKYMAYY